MENELFNLCYRKRLEDSLYQKRSTAINQVGTSDLEDNNYIQNIEKWYSQLYNAIDNCPPINYVKELRVFENDDRIIDSIEYYYQENELIDDVALCIIRL